jgi:hypothetical protein
VCDSILDYERAAATDTSDRVCQRLTVCQFKVSFESVAPTRTSDRVCKAVTVCVKKKEFLFTPAALFTDNILPRVQEVQRHVRGSQRRMQRPRRHHLRTHRPLLRQCLLERRLL